MGTELLSYLALGKESSKGTSVAATRRYGNNLAGSFTIDNMYNLHESRVTGRRNPVSYASTQGTLVTINYQNEASWDELQTVFQFPDGGTAVGVGTAVWTHSFGGTAAGSWVTYTAEFGDDVQEWEAEYCFATNGSLSADVGGTTMVGATLVGRQATKSTKTALNIASPYVIPTYLWQLKFASAQSGLSGASYQTGMLKSFNLQWQTGLTPGKYLDGTSYFTSGNETLPFMGTLDMTVVQNSTAVSTFYDNFAPSNGQATPYFFMLNATGPAIGASAYAANISVCAIPTAVTPNAQFIDGQSCMDVSLALAFDETWGNSMQTVVTNARTTFV